MNGITRLILLSGFLAGCNKETANQTVPLLPVNAPVAQTACFASGPVLRRANNLTGRISRLANQELYVINYSVPGTYDSVWTGLTCNLPDEYKTMGKEVVFSGEYRKGPEGLNLFGGQEIYYLFLTSVRAK